MTHRSALVTVLALGFGCWAGVVLAQTPDAKPMRLAGEAAGATDPAPKAFVIDALVSPGDSDEQTRIEGWFAATEAPAASGEVTGTCVENHCTLTADLDGAKFDLTGDFGAATGPAQAHFTLKDGDDKVVQTGAVTLSTLNGPVPGLGPLAEPGAITEAQLDELLVWAHQTVPSGSPPGDGPPTSDQNEALATWQDTQGRLATGLILAGDLAQLKTDEAAAKKAAGWTVLGDAAHGWSAGYPAALLPRASRKGAEQRFASADGRAVLVVAVDPPLSSDAFDALATKLTADRKGRGQTNMTQTNGDLEFSYEEGGKATSAVYRNRDGGLARLVFTYPAEGGDAYQAFETILQHALVVTDDLKP